MSDWHLYPATDSIGHEKSSDCPCHPVQHFESRVWLHNSALEQEIARAWLEFDPADEPFTEVMSFAKYRRHLRVAFNAGAKVALALAAGSRRAETNEDLAQCEASQSGGEAVTPKEGLS